MIREKEMYAEYKAAHGEHIVIVWQWTEEKGGSWRMTTNLFCPDQSYAQNIVAAFPPKPVR